MRNIITGGSGFIGGAIAKELLQRGEEVVVFDLVEPVDLPDGFTFIKGSVLEVKEIEAATQGCDAVFHVAGDARIWKNTAGQDVNARGTVNALAAAQRAGVKHVVHTSSITVYVGESTTPDEVEATERAADLPFDAMLGAYSQSKWKADQAAFEAASSGLPVTLVAPSMPIGPGDVNLTPPGRMVLDYLTGKTPAYLETRLNIIDVRDLATGMVAARDKGRVGARYFIGGHNITLSKLLAALEQVSGRKMPKTRVSGWLAEAVAKVSTSVSDRFTKSPPKAPLEGVQFARRAPSLSNALAVQELGLSCRPLEETLQAAIEDFTARGLM